jgi:hypothetical protein
MRSGPTATQIMAAQLLHHLAKHDLVAELDVGS